MKTTHACPKCRGTRLLHVRQVADRLGESYDHHLDERPKPGARTDEPSDQWRIARVAVEKKPGKSVMITAGRVEAFVCRACGFTEFYTRDLDEIPVDGRNVIAIEGPAPTPSR